MIHFVCPVCKGPLEAGRGAYSCGSCQRVYPVLCGIPDFRILPDRYISIEDDRNKGARLFEEARRRSFAEMLDYYYSITPEVPPELARKFTAHALVEEKIAAATLAQIPAQQAAGALLDAGCSTGGLLVAAARRFPAVVGVDVAFRWLVVGTARLREAGVEAALVCANAEYLPFAGDTFAVVTAVDLVEHVFDPAPLFTECRRVARPGAMVYFSTNNRYSLAREPHANVWGAGWLPRRLQEKYVKLVSGRSYRNIALRSAGELRAQARAAGFEACDVAPAPLAVPGRAERLQTLYNRVRGRPGFSRVLRAIGPRLELSCRK